MLLVLASSKRVSCLNIRGTRMLESVRPHADTLLSRLARLFVPLGVPPNVLSVVALALAAASGVLIVLSAHRNSDFNSLLALAAGLLGVSALLDALDGALARELRAESKKGDFLDHALDRYADVLVLCGVIFGGYTPAKIGVAAVVGVLLTSYMGTQAQAVGFSREYRGILSRADRLLILILATLMNAFYQKELRLAFLSFTILGWCMLVFAVLCNITALQRFFYVWRRL
ncbi:MAG: Phosphatidylglycerophosphate synthase [Candidatus Alkanophagales archaeon MCA70_species_2]|nr:Phosphatidylglycerophosphate synthase [Candidatus Alkanophaga liquidiphilum]